MTNNHRNYFYRNWLNYLIPLLKKCLNLLQNFSEYDINQLIVEVNNIEDIQYVNQCQKKQHVSVKYFHDGI